MCACAHVLGEMGTSHPLSRGQSVSASSRVFTQLLCPEDPLHARCSHCFFVINLPNKTVR